MAELELETEETEGIVEPAAEAVEEQRPGARVVDARAPKSRARRWLVRLAVPLVLLVALAVYFARGERPREVTLVAPTAATLTETIASSGRVGGAAETLVGAQASGVVERLFVREGDRVSAGQRLALIRNDVATAQVEQARQAVRTAEAQLADVSSGPRRTDVAAGSQRIQQARAQVEQQRAAVRQAQQSVDQARALLRQLEAERSLQAREYERSVQLVEQGVISRSQFDQAQTALRVAEERVAAQRQAVDVATAGLEAARAGVSAAEANVRTQQSELQGIREGATSEEVDVARQRVRDAQEALRVAERQAGNAVVTAPFDGVVTAINAELGQAVGAQGLLALVSNQAEIRLEVDESNLATLAVGQEAVVTSSAFPGGSFRGTVTEIGAAVNEARGTVEVTVTPVDPPEWLRPGQTLNVNVITAQAAERLLVPQEAVVRSGDRNVVFVVEDGYAVEKPVVTRAPTEGGVPVVAGLDADDRVVASAAGLEAGDPVRVGKAGGGD